MREHRLALRLSPTVARQRLSELAPDPRNEVGVTTLLKVRVAGAATLQRREFLVQQSPHPAIRRLRHDASDHRTQQTEISDWDASDQRAWPRHKGRRGVDPSYASNRARLNRTVFEPHARHIARGLPERADHESHRHIILRAGSPPRLVTTCGIQIPDRKSTRL